MNDSHRQGVPRHFGNRSEGINWRPKSAKTRKEAFQIAKEVINEAAGTDSIGGWHTGETVMVRIEQADE
jgi:hypothetical protein